MLRPRAESLLEGWVDGFQSTPTTSPRYLVYPLEHQYTTSNLSLAGLKSTDRLRAECLRESVAATGSEVFLATMERHVLQDDEPGNYLCEVYKRTCKLRHLIRLDGTMVGDGIDVTEDNILRIEDLVDEPQREEHSGFTGNEGCTADYWYRDTVSSPIPPARASASRSLTT
jgi:hypothetical protein